MRLAIIALIVLISLIPPSLEWRKSKKIDVGPLPPADAKAEASELEEILHPDD